MWAVFQEGAITPEVLHTIGVLELLSVSQAENQCSLIAMDYISKELRPALFLLTQHVLRVGQASGKPIIQAGCALVRWNELLASSPLEDSATPS